MAQRGVLGVQPFPHKFRDKPAVILGIDEWVRYFFESRKGHHGSIEMYATAPIGTEVWVRYGIHYHRGAQTDRAKWQCLARVTKSELTQPGTQHTFPKYRTTFVLIGDPERSEY